MDVTSWPKTGSFDAVQLWLSEDDVQHLVAQYDECVANYGYMPSDIRRLFEGLRAIKEQDMSDQQQQNPQPEQNPQPQQQPDTPAPVEPAPVDQPATTQEQQDTEG